MTVEMSYIKVIFDSYSLQIVSAFPMTRITRVFLPIFAILILRSLSLQSLSFILFLPTDLIKFYGIVFTQTRTHKRPPNGEGR